MTGRSLIRRERARRDLEEAADYHFAEGGDTLEARFIDSIEHKLNLIADRPAIGSLRYARVLQRSDLRCFPAKRFQYLVFYVAFPYGIDVLPILQGRRDIPTILQAPSRDGKAGGLGKVAVRGSMITIMHTFSLFYLNRTH